MLTIDLSGKVALVTASSRGIGKGIATVLSMSGANVILVSRNLEKLRQVAVNIKKKSGKNVDFIKTDLTSLRDLRRLVNRVKRKFGGVDIFIFNTGGPRPGYFKELGMRDWENAVKLLLYPAVYLTHSFIENMITKGWGRVIYSTSIAIKEPVKGLVLSNVVRISMAGLVRSLAKEYASNGITVNAIMPGYIETERIRELAVERARESDENVEKIIKDMSKDIPIGRMGKPEEIGYLTAFLSSDYATYINGAIIPVDGGLLNSSL